MNAEIERYYMFRGNQQARVMEEIEKWRKDTDCTPVFGDNEGAFTAPPADLDAIIDEYLVLREVGTPERPCQQLVFRSPIGGFDVAELGHGTSLIHCRALWKRTLRDMLEKARG